MLIDLFLITLIIVFIIDISGFIDEMETILSKWLKGKARVPKPFSCSLCMTWWTGLIYLLIIGEFTLLWIATVALFALLSGVLATLLICIRETLNCVIEKAYNALK
jgi:hypothetical protein